MPEPEDFTAPMDGGLALSPPREGSPPAALRRLLGRLTGSPLVRRVAGGAFWSVVGTGVARLLALGAAVLVARQLGAAAFGEYNLVQTTAGMFQALAGFGLGTTATKFLSGRCRADPDAAGRIVALSELVAGLVGAAATAALVLTSSFIAARVLGAPQLSRSLRVGAFLLLLGSVNGAQFGILAGLERFRLLAVVSGISAAVSIPLLVVGARQGGVRGGVIGLDVSAAVTVLVYGLAVAAVTRQEGILVRYATAFREWRILFSFSMPATFSNLLLTPVAWITSAIVANQPHGLSELGLFSAANQWRNAIVLLASSAGAVLFPVFSHLHHTGRKRALARTFWTSLAAVAASSLAAALALSLLAPWIMRAYGSEFGHASRLLVLMVAAGALSALLNVAGQVIAGVGRMWLGFGLTAVWAATLVGTALALRSRGALGLSLAYLAAYLVHLLLALGCAQRLLRRRAAPASDP